MASGCRSPMSICAVRLSRLNSSGANVSNHTAGAIAQQGGVGTLKWTADIVAGDKIREKDGCGNLAVVRDYDDRLAGFNVELDLLIYSYELRELAYGAQLITNGATVLGAADTVDTACGTTTAKNGVVVEAWGENQECSALDATYPYHRVVFTKVVFNPTDGEMKAGANHMVLKGYARVNDGAGNGPYNDWPSSVLAITNKARFTMEDTTLPTASTDCGYATLPSQS